MSIAHVTQTSRAIHLRRLTENTMVRRLYGVHTAAEYSVESDCAFLCLLAMRLS